jgi:hypothetical protein
MEPPLRHNVIEMLLGKDIESKEHTADVSTFRKRITTSLASVSALLAGTSAFIKRKRQQSSPKLLPSLLANFGLTSLKQPLTEPHTLTKCPMLTTPCLPFTLGTEIHGDSTEADHSFAWRAWVCDKDRLGCRLVSGVHHAADVSLCLVRTRREGRRGARTQTQEASTSLSKSCLSRF